MAAAADAVKQRTKEQAAAYDRYLGNPRIHSDDDSQKESDTERASDPEATSELEESKEEIRPTYDYKI